MCLKCELQDFSRRKLLGLGGLAFASALLEGRLSYASDGPTTTVTTDEAIAKLKAGNDKYLQAPEVCARDLKANREHVAKQQTPWATILSCSDSRVPPELLFGGLGVGELFVTRNAGNTIDTATMGTIEYGAAVLKVPLILVMGHERCGAVVAACEIVEKQATFPGFIGKMVETIVPAARKVEKAPGDFVDNAVRENARQSARKVETDSKIVADLVKAGKVKVLAARYDLDDGRVEYLA
jgi:carbonic anhydrase